MITKIIIRENNKPFRELFISSETKGRDLILEVERKIVPDSFDFCKPLVKSKVGFVRGHIEYIVDRREQFVVMS
jgi:hypothetical protein